MTENFEIVEAKPEQKPLVKRMRKAVFVGEDRYPVKEIWQDYDNGSRHFFLLENNKEVGVFSLAQGDVLPIEDNLRLSEYKGVKNAEIYKFAIEKDQRNTLTTLFFLIEIYRYLAKEEIDTLFIHSKIEKTRNIRMYEKIGFKHIANIDHPNRGKLVVMFCQFKSKTFKAILKRYREHYEV